MKLVKTRTLFDGRHEGRNLFVGFDSNEITFVGKNKQDGEIIADGTVTPAFIDSHSHILE